MGRQQQTEMWRGWEKEWDKDVLGVGKEVVEVSRADGSTHRNHEVLSSFHGSDCVHSAEVSLAVVLETGDHWRAEVGPKPTRAEEAWTKARS